MNLQLYIPKGLLNSSSPLPKQRMKTPLVSKIETRFLLLSLMITVDEFLSMKMDDGCFS